jgi:hypothetical protein
MFAWHPERFPAGRQDADTLSSAEKRRDQAGGGVNDVFAIVEHQQHPTVRQGGQQARKGIFGADLQAKHHGDRARYQPRIAQRREIDQPDAVLISIDHPLGDSEGDRGLTNAARPDDCHQALARKAGDKRRRDFLATNHAGCRERQIVWRRRRGGRRPQGRRRTRFAYWRHEIVAPSNNGGDVTIVALAVADGTP